MRSTALSNPKRRRAWVANEVGCGSGLGGGADLGWQRRKARDEPLHPSILPVAALWHEMSHLFQAVETRCRQLFARDETALGMPTRTRIKAPFKPSAYTAVCRQASARSPGAAAEHAGSVAAGLGDESSEVRTAAAAVLGKIGQAAAEHVARLLVAEHDEQTA